MFEPLMHYRTEAGRAINHRYLADESELLADLAARATTAGDAHASIERTAESLIEIIRREHAGKSGLDAFLHEYDLSSAEGIVLMCLAEALLRIPDDETADALIADRLGAGDWSRHLGESESLFVNASTWGLMLTGRLVAPDASAVRSPGDYLRQLIGRLGEPVVRTAIRHAMGVMGEQFVMGRTIAEAIRRAGRGDQARYRHSYDMLGEAALTDRDARGFCTAYAAAIETVGAANATARDTEHASVSVKLSALSPRLVHAHFADALADAVPRLLELARLARERGVPLTVDAEESHRLELTLEIFSRVFRDQALIGWEGLGIAIQAYQRRAVAVVAWLAGLAAQGARRIPVRLVKGAYWDTEIKLAQELGWSSYPVFTRKVNTDVSYLACARELLDRPDCFRPQFATHNAHTVAWILHTAGPGADYEFQRLHGMGEALYERVVDPDGYGRPCRVYAPVGQHEELLPYLVRRLLENGANTSFVNRIEQETQDMGELICDPVAAALANEQAANPRIVDPPRLFGAARRNAAGVNLNDGEALAQLATEMERALARPCEVRPIIGGEPQSGQPVASINPADPGQVVGRVEAGDADLCRRAVASAVAAFPAWDRAGPQARAAILLRAADLFESGRAGLMALCIAEAGKTLPAALAEVREAVDFLRYYAAEAVRVMGHPRQMPGPTGESNELFLGGRGPFVCISPWNFPLAIFTGQVAAALAAGNTVVAKPAEQTSLTAGLATRLLLEAGVPAGVLNLVPGDGSLVGATLVADERVAGVAFTGSTVTAQLINRSLAARDGPIAVLVAETGGQNAMIVDSTALPEQVVRDAVASAFDSAGQRCSALRVLCLQHDIADRVVDLLTGHMAQLTVGSPARLDVDVGPVIDAAALEQLRAHRESLRQAGALRYECPLPADLPPGYFMAPVVAEIPSISMLKEEHFGPILHIVRYRRSELDSLLGTIADTGYGLTLGLQSRIEHRAARVAAAAPAGNVYVNRNMIGAVVGVQPFGGRGLSGTGPKAGGPNYLLRFVSERTVTVNTAAIGGNATLLSNT